MFFKLWHIFSPPYKLLFNFIHFSKEEKNLDYFWKIKKYQKNFESFNKTFDFKIEKNFLFQEMIVFLRKKISKDTNFMAETPNNGMNFLYHYFTYSPSFQQTLMTVSFKHNISKEEKLKIEPKKPGLLGLSQCFFHFSFF